MKRIENREILQQVRKETSEKIEKSRCRILICAGTGCLAGGSGEIYEKMCELTQRIRMWMCSLDRRSLTQRQNKRRDLWK